MKKKYFNLALIIFCFTTSLSSQENTKIKRVKVINLNKKEYRPEKKLNLNHSPVLNKNDLPKATNLKSKLESNNRKGINIVSEEEIKSWQDFPKVALIIGVNDYKNLSKLNFAISDSIKMKLSLEQVGGFKKIILMNDEIGEGNPSLYPTKENIEKAIKSLLIDRPYTFIFYFSGHGFMNKERENVIAPIDIIYKKNDYIQNSISINDIVKQTEGIPQSILFLDACREKLTNDTKSGGGEFFDELPDSVLNAKGTAIMMGTSPGGYSYENPELGSGTFTHFLVQGLNGGVQDEQNRPYVTFSSLKEYVERNIGEYTQKMSDKKQIPYIAGDYTGSFLLSTKLPSGQVKSRIAKYIDGSKQIRYSRSIFDVEDSIVSQYFYIFGIGKSYIPADLDGVGKLSFSRNQDSYSIKQYGLEGEFVFDFGFKKLEEGWEYRGIEKGNFVKIIYDKKGNEVKKEEYGSNGKIQKSANSYIKKIEYSNDKIKSATYYSLDGSPKEDENEIHNYKYDYNKNGKLEEVTHYGMDGKIKENKIGLAKLIRKYNTDGFLLEEKYQTASGKLRANEKGIAKYEYEFDQKNNLISEKFYNEENNLFGKGIITQKRYTYDLDGKLLSKEFQDGNGDLVEDSSGDARIEFKYDKSGNIISESYLSSKKTLKKHGIAIKLFNYGVNGKLKNMSFYNYKEKPYSDRFSNISRYEFEYDKYGNKVKELFYGIDGNLLEDVNGTSIKEFIYENSRLVKEIFKNKEGNSGETSKFTFQKVYSYNDQGRLISEEFLSDKGYPIQDRNGINKKIYIYDTRGRKIQEETRNIDDKLKDNSYKIAKIIYFYDEKDRPIGEEKYDSDEILKKTEYRIFVPNPFEAKGKELVVHLDKFRRPIEVEINRN